jgi:hypothetical protein
MFLSMTHRKRVLNTSRKICERGGAQQQLWGCASAASLCR